MLIDIRLNDLGLVSTDILLRRRLFVTETLAMSLCSHAEKSIYITERHLNHRYLTLKLRHRIEFTREYFF